MNRPSQGSAPMQQADNTVNADIRASEDARVKRLVTGAAIIVTLLIITTKIWAWWLSGGAALLGSLTDSLLDIVVSIINFVAVRQALLPPDEDHRFGHEKAEAIAGILQTAIIGGSSLFLVIESLRQIVNPQTVDRPGIAIGVSTFAIVLTLALVLAQNAVIRRTGSVAIAADQLHYKGDVGLNLGVILSCLLAGYGGWVIVDGLFGLAIAAYIGWSAAIIFRRSLDILMDKELAQEERNKILKLVTGHPRVMHVHEMRTRSSGNQIFIQLHIGLEENLSLRAAHDIAVAVETRIQVHYPAAEILVHVDPVALTARTGPRVLH